MDLVVDRRVVVEWKAVESLAPILKLLSSTLQVQGWVVD
jgi:hypothetical protein